MRAFPRPDRLEVRLGNVLCDVSGEIVTRRPLAAGTGAYEAARDDGTAGVATRRSKNCGPGEKR